MRRLIIKRLLLLAASICLLRLNAFADPLITRKNAARGVSLPLFGRDRTVPAATVKIGDLGIGAQRQGFLRIGILPEVLARDVWIVFKHAEPAALSELAETLQALTKTSEMELREVQFLAPHAAEPCLTVACARLDGSDSWELSGVTFPSGQTVSSAKLRVRGNAAGELSFEDNHSMRTLQILPVP